MTHRLQLIGAVWMVETIGVTAGLLNAAYTTFGDALPTTLEGFAPALPMLVLPAAELIRVPIISAFYRKKLTTRCIVLASVAMFTWPAAENWTLGFDRIAQMRVKQIVEHDNIVSKARAAQTTAGDAYLETNKRTEAKRDELRNSITVRDQNIASLNGQLKTASDAHVSNLDQIRSGCRIVAGPCVVPRSQTEDRRYADETGDLRNALATAENERRDFVHDIDRLVQDDEAKAALLAIDKGRLAAELSNAAKAAHEARNDNVIYRLAASVFGVGVDDLTASQIGKARFAFAAVPAIVIAMIGPLGALIHYSPDRAPNAPSFLGAQIAKLTRARRAFLARRRKTLSLSDKTLLDFLQLAHAVRDESMSQERAAMTTPTPNAEGAAASTFLAVDGTASIGPQPTPPSSHAGNPTVATAPSLSDAAHQDAAAGSAPPKDGTKNSTVRQAA